MTLFEAVFKRSSIRWFRPEPVDPVRRGRLEKVAEQCARRSGLRLELRWEDAGWLENMQGYLLLAGPEEEAHLEEKCGYFGEKLVLTAAAMGLGSCWLGSQQGSLEPGVRLVCAVALGCAPDHGAPAARHNTPLSPDAASAPAWFRGGLEAAAQAPSAMNRQNWRFSLLPDGTAQAEALDQRPFALVDLGIAKLHFELGAHGGQWTWGSGGLFQKAREEKSCGAVVWRRRDGRREYLLARHNGGHWGFPKGHVEGSETEEETARREIWEETGLEAAVSTAFRRQVTYYPKPGVIKDVIFFTATPVGGAEHAQETEISEIGWFAFLEACGRVTYATDEEVLLAAEDYLEQAEG